MHLSLDRMVDFITIHGLHPNQFFLLYSLYVDRAENRSEDTGTPTYTSKLAYLTQEVTGEPLWTIKDIRKLEQKGFLIDNNEAGRIYTGKLEVTELFSDEFFIGDDQFDEFFEAYPWSVLINGNNATLRS